MTAPPPPKPRRDPLPWIYWGLFFIAVPLVTLWMANKPAPRAELPALADDVPAYHVITGSEVVTITVGADEVMTDTVCRASDLVAHYTREALRAGEPIRSDQIGMIADPGLISNTLAVAVPADSALVLGGNLQAGDVVRLTALPVSGTTSAPAIVFDAVLVLDVESTGDETVVVLAIPADHWLTYVEKTRDATLMLGRRVE